MRELVDRVRRHCSGEGLQSTSIPQLQIVMSTEPSKRVHALQQPALCYVAQGTKVATVGGHIHHYAQGAYLVSTVELPVTGEVIEASQQEPYMCFMVELDPRTVYRVAKTANFDPAPPSAPGVFVAQAESTLSDAITRLVRCLDSDHERKVLAEGILHEIVYRLLCSEFGGVVSELATDGSRTQRIARAIEHLKNAYDQSIRLPELAKLAGMSVSSFHQHFKSVTTMSPLQYQKQLRLQEAYRLLTTEDTNAAEVSFRVGYQSPSQFSREYTRLFGAPPIRHARGEASKDVTTSSKALV